MGYNPDFERTWRQYHTALNAGKPLAALNAACKLYILYDANAKPHKAKSICEEVLQWYKASGFSRPVTHTSCCLAVVYLRLGQRRNAKTLYENALGRRMSDSPLHPETWRLIYHLSRLYEKRDLNEARAIYLWILHKNIYEIGDELALRTIDAVARLGNRYASRGGRAIVVWMYRKAIDGLEKVAGFHAHCHNQRRRRRSANMYLY